MHPACRTARKQPKASGHHHGAGLEVAPGPGGDLLAAKPTDTAQAHSHRPALAIEFDRSDERRLARRASPGFPPAALPAPIRIIELHPTAQRARVIALLHHLHQLVLDLPGGVVAHRKLPRQLQRRNTILRLRHQVHRQEPRAKRKLRAGQDRARGQRHLVPAPAALIQRPALMAPVPGMLASGANEPVRPTPTKQRLRALLLGPVLVQKLHETVALLKLHPITRHGRLPIFQLLGTIRVRLAHWMSLVRNQDEIYEDLARERAYNVRMIDGALIQMMYEFVEARLRRHRLAFFLRRIWRNFKTVLSFILRTNSMLI